MIIEDHKYEFDAFSNVHQVDIPPNVHDQYNIDYVVHSYANPVMFDKVKAMSKLRADYVLNVIAKHQEVMFTDSSVVDFGCGSGEFLYEMSTRLSGTMYGIDINGYPLPIGEKGSIKSVSSFKDIPDDILFTSFFDSLEHVPDYITTVKEAAAISKYIVISTPWLVEGQELKGWRHFKPNEHLHYFSARGLTLALNRNCGLVCIDSRNIEDTIRTPPDGVRYNILTSIFVHKEEYE